jgi:hypothetical protein
VAGFVGRPPSWILFVILSEAKNPSDCPPAMVALDSLLRSCGTAQVCHPERSEGSSLMLLTGNALLVPWLRSG